MADSTKRNSVAGKVATPKSSGSPATQMQPLRPQDPFESLGKVIGARVKITTAAPPSQSLEGALYTADPILNIVAINTRASSTNGTAQPGDYHIVPSATIRSFQIVHLPSADVSFSNAAPSIGPIDARQLQTREETRVAQLKEQEENRGRGVSKDGQALFDALKRINMQVRWHGPQIVVNDIAMIQPPYEVNDINGSPDKTDATQRIKKVVEGEKKKLKEKEERERKAATPAGPRKGG